MFLIPRQTCQFYNLGHYRPAPKHQNTPGVQTSPSATRVGVGVDVDMGVGVVEETRVHPRYSPCGRNSTAKSG